MISVVKDFIYSNLDFFVLVIIPAVLIFIILWICKYYNFNILPDDFKKRNRKSNKEILKSSTIKNIYD